MKWVQQAALHPHRCAVLPYVGNSSTTKGFLDTEQDVDLDRIYLSGEFLEAVIPLMGFVPAGTVQGLERKVAKAEARVAEVEAERDELQRQIDAIAVLKSAGYRGSRQPGRPPKQKAVV